VFAQAAVQRSLPKMPPRVQAVFPGRGGRLPGVLRESGGRAEKRSKRVLFLTKISPVSGDMDGGRVLYALPPFLCCGAGKVGK